MARPENCEGVLGSSGYIKFIPACEGGNSVCVNCPEEVRERFRGPKPPESQRRIPEIDYHGVTGFVRILPKLKREDWVPEDFPDLSNIWLPIRDPGQHPRLQWLSTDPDWTHWKFAKDNEGSTFIGTNPHQEVMVRKDDFLRAVNWLYSEEVTKKLEAEGGEWWIFRNIDVDYVDMRETVREE